METGRRIIERIKDQFGKKAGTAYLMHTVVAGQAGHLALAAAALIYIIIHMLHVARPDGEIVQRFVAVLVPAAAAGLIAPLPRILFHKRSQPPLAPNEMAGIVLCGFAAALLYAVWPILHVGVAGMQVLFLGSVAMLQRIAIFVHRRWIWSTLPDISSQDMQRAIVEGKHGTQLKIECEWNTWTQNFRKDARHHWKRLSKCRCSFRFDTEKLKKKNTTCFVQSDPSLILTLPWLQFRSEAVRKETTEETLDPARELADKQKDHVNRCNPLQILKWRMGTRMVMNVVDGLNVLLNPSMEERDNEYVFPVFRVKIHGHFTPNAIAEEIIPIALQDASMQVKFARECDFSEFIKPGWFWFALKVDNLNPRTPWIQSLLKFANGTTAGQVRSLAKVEYRWIKLVKIRVHAEWVGKKLVTLDLQKEEGGSTTVFALRPSEGAAPSSIIYFPMKDTVLQNGQSIYVREEDQHHIQAILPDAAVYDGSGERSFTDGSGTFADRSESLQHLEEHAAPGRTGSTVRPPSCFSGCAAAVRKRIGRG